MKKLFAKLKALPKNKKILILIGSIIVLLIFCCGILSLIPSSNNSLKSTITPTIAPTTTLTPTLTITSTITPTKISFLDKISTAVYSTSTEIPLEISTKIPFATFTQIPTEVWPKNATAKCNDGTFSNSQTKQGTCSGHKGILEWRGP
jgi:hypothetical protein